MYISWICDFFQSRFHFEFSAQVIPVRASSASPFWVDRILPWPGHRQSWWGSRSGPGRPSNPGRQNSGNLGRQNVFKEIITLWVVHAYSLFLSMVSIQVEFINSMKIIHETLSHRPANSEPFCKKDGHCLRGGQREGEGRYCFKTMVLKRQKCIKFLP